MADQSPRIPALVTAKCLLAGGSTLKSDATTIKVNTANWHASLSSLVDTIGVTFPFLSEMDASEWSLRINGTLIDKQNVKQYQQAMMKTPSHALPALDIVKTLANEEEDNTPSRHIRVVFNDKSFSWAPPWSSCGDDNEEADDVDKQWGAHYASFMQQAKQQFGITSDDIKFKSVMGGTSCDFEGADELHELWSELHELTEVPVIKVIVPDEEMDDDEEDNAGLAKRESLNEYLTKILPLMLADEYSELPEVELSKISDFVRYKNLLQQESAKHEPDDLNQKVEARFVHALHSLRAEGHSEYGICSALQRAQSLTLTNRDYKRSN